VPRLDVANIDVMELNGHFASQPRDCAAPPGLPDGPEYANPKGGAIALGHPLGISGARLVLSAAIELSDRGVERAVATMCIGVGQAHLATPAVGLIGIHLAEVSRFWR
jgi:acetyl-CoA acyltransferase